jgi:hypothetical protein
MELYPRQFLLRSNKFQREWGAYISSPNPKKAQKIFAKWGPVRVPGCLRLHKTAWGLWEEASELFWGERVAEPQVRTHISPRLLRDGRLCKSADSGKGFVVCDVGTNDIPDELIIRLENFASYVNAEKKDKASFRKAVLSLIKEQLLAWERVSKKFKLHRETRAKEYQSMLEVWDLVNEVGRHWTKISNIIDPDNKSRDSAREIARQRHKSACELIRELEKPWYSRKDKIKP